MPNRITGAMSQLVTRNPGEQPGFRGKGGSCRFLNFDLVLLDRAAPRSPPSVPDPPPRSVTTRTRIARSHPGVPESSPIRLFIFRITSPKCLPRSCGYATTASYRTAKKQRRIFGPLCNAEWYCKQRSSARAKPRPGPGLRNKDRAQREELPRDHQRERLQRELPHRTKHIRTRHDRSWNIHVRAAHER